MSTGFSALLARLIDGDSLTREEMADLFGRLMDGDVGPAMQAAILTALAAKGETVDEITGAVEAMRARLLRVHHPYDDAIDTCGTGGDELGTFNISTAAAIVAAAGGARVAKHGNRSVSSRSGSADVLEALGMSVESTPEAAADALERVGIAFLFAPAFHPAMKAVMPVRHELGVRTLFNLIGPLTNPAGVSRQVLGVYGLELVEPVGEVLRRLGTRHALVVHGHDGQDEMSVTGPTRLAEVRPEGVEVRDLEPESLGIERVELADLMGGDGPENADRMRRLLGGEPGPLADAVALNGGAALYVAGRAETLQDGLDKARQLLCSGGAAARLEAMLEMR